jgi:hypothetical protein
MQHREQAAAVTSLRNFAAADQPDHRRQKKPEKLRHRQRKDRQNRPEAAPACQRCQGPATGTNKEHRQNCARGECKFSRESQGEDQRIAGRAGVKAQH